MKQILNQRYIYKINSSYLNRKKWNVEFKDIKLAIKNRFIVGVGDSNGLRMIRELKGTNETCGENSINILKDDIKVKRKKNEDTKVLDDKLYELCLEECVCNVVFNSNKQYDKACKDGFYINGKHYVFLLATTGGIKNSTCMFIREDLHDDLWIKIYNDFDKTVPMIPSKLMAYISLVFSSSIPVTSDWKVLVVKDVETKFKAPVTHIEFNDDKGEPDVELIENKDIIVNACDGCGLVMPHVMEQWSKDICEDYVPTSVCIRNAWVKGMATSFDFRAYSSEVIGQSTVVDVWGNEHDINDIDIILNESMLKCWKGYKSIEDYMSSCKKHGHTFAITKVVPKELENKRKLNYQYIQCLNLLDEDINNLLINDITEIKEVLGLDYRKTIIFSKGKELNDKNVWNEDTKDDLFIKALMCDKEVIKDEYVIHRIKKLINKRIKLLKTGKINVEGNYQISIGEPIIQIENMFGLEPKGLLNANEFWVSYWKDKNIEKVAGFRSPMSCKSNARIMNICNRKEVEKWYGNIKNVIMFNAWDTSMMAFNGQDHDADMNFTSSNKILIKGIFNEPAIDCEGVSGAKIPNITIEQFMKACQQGFGNSVGSITNQGSSMYSTIAQFDVGSEEYKELDKRIKCIQLYQQYEIDRCKTGGEFKPLPDHWTNFRSDKVKINVSKDGEILDDEETIKLKQFNQRILTEKKPYYFNYIYDSMNADYIKFYKNCRVACLRKFRCNVEDLYSKEYLTKEENEFLEWYEKKIPVSMNKCVVNKIAWIVDGNFNGTFGRMTDKNIDWSIYQNKDILDIGDKKQIRKVVKLCNDYSKTLSNKTFVEYNNKDEIYGDMDDRDSVFLSDIYNVIPNEDVLLNTLLELSYNKSKIGRWLCWFICGNLIVKNILNNNKNIIEYPYKCDDGDFEYDGDLFKMVSLEVDIND